MKNIIIISHRRSGTHLSIDLFRNNILKSDSYLNLDLLIDVNQRSLDTKGLEKKLGNSPKIIKTHLLPSFNIYLDDKKDITYLEKLFSSSTLFYVKRDGKDVMVSLFHYIQKFDKSIKNSNFSTFLKTPNQFDPTEESQSRPKFWAYHVALWKKSKYELTNLLFEDLARDYTSAVLSIAKNLNLKLNIQEVEDVRLKSTSKLSSIFKKVLVKFRISKKNTAVGFRKGQIGDFEKYFSTEDLKYFNLEINQSNIEHTSYK